MADPDSVPATPDEYIDSNPASPGSDDESSEASTPLDPPSSSSDAIPSPPPGGSSLPKRVPSLRTVSDPQHAASHMSISSSVAGTLNSARRPTPAASSLPIDLMQKARALQQQRMGKPPPRPGLATQSSGPLSDATHSPIGGGGGGGGAVASPIAGMPGGLPGNLRLPGQLNMGRPLPPGFPKSAPIVPSAMARKGGPSLSERRAMKLGGLPGSGPGSPSPKLSDLGGGGGGGGVGGGAGGGGPDGARPSLNGTQQDSKMNDFKNYIDAEKGWITFEGAATITRTGVNFASGQTFSISLDEIEVLDELGKGNYGTVYKVRHARPRVPRFGTGLSGFKAAPSRQASQSEKDQQQQQQQQQPLGSTPTAAAAVADGSSPISPVVDGGGRADGTSGVVMAMKEIRLELDESKFTTILKELVILHECVSPYIIDFYGAFFQEGAVYMCIEYMDGGSIDKLYGGGIPENVLRKITYATVMGLKTLKDKHKIIHRDVKPTNILANTRGQVKICDFGVSGNLVASIAKTNIGCQSYMAPERISGGGMSQAGANSEGTYSVQSDIWSLGLTIIECAMGRYPYPPEVSSTIFSQLSAIVEGEPPDMPSEGYSATVQDFVRSCLNKNPKKRATYPMLLAHPWLKPLTQPETIAEDEETEADDDAALAQAAAKVQISSGPGGDAEVAAWVQGVLAGRKKKGDGSSSTAEKPARPALHAAPLDSVSPVGSGAPLAAED